MAFYAVYHQGLDCFIFRISNEYLCRAKHFDNKHLPPAPIHYLSPVLNVNITFLPTSYIRRAVAQF